MLEFKAGDGELRPLITRACRCGPSSAARGTRGNAISPCRGPGAALGPWQGCRAPDNRSKYSAFKNDCPTTRGAFTRTPSLRPTAFPRHADARLRQCQPARAHGQHATPGDISACAQLYTRIIPHREGISTHWQLSTRVSVLLTKASPRISISFTAHCSNY